MTRKQGYKGGKPPVGEWWKRANCRETHPSVMYPRDNWVEIQAALEVCKGCPVSGECLEYAQTSPKEWHGVWGGYTAADRARLTKGLATVGGPTGRKHR